MKTERSNTVSMMALMGLAVASCSANIHDNTIDIRDAKVSLNTNVDANNVAPGQVIPIMLTVEKIYLIDPAMTPPPEHVEDAGHVQVYLDDTSKPPILITAEVNISVTIPPETKAGNHRLICRLHKHDGTPTTTQTEIAIVVKVTVTNGDAGVIVTTDANPGSAGAMGAAGSTGAGGSTGVGGTTGAGGAGGAAGNN